MGPVIGSPLGGFITTYLLALDLLINIRSG
jgi:hypothetical protein